MEKEISKCDECGSEYYSGSSLMKNICPECAHALYGYPNCSHVFENGRCMLCYWDGSKSDYLKKQDVPAEESGVSTKPQSEAVTKSLILIQAGNYQEALKILIKEGKTDNSNPAVILLTLFCSYQVKNTQELLNKVTTDIPTVKTFLRRADLNRLSGLLWIEENELVSHMLDYCWLELLVSGNSISDILAGLRPDKVTIKNRSESSFSKMDKEDVYDTKRADFFSRLNDPYEFDPIEELDDIKVKFKSTFDHPDLTAGDVLGASGHLLLDMITFMERFDYNFNASDEHINRPPLSPHDYGTNPYRKTDSSVPGYTPPKRQSAIVGGYKIGDIPKTREEQIVRKDEVLKLILEEEQQVLSL